MPKKLVIIWIVMSGLLEIGSRVPVTVVMELLAEVYTANGLLVKLIQLFVHIYHVLQIIKAALLVHPANIQILQKKKSSSRNRFKNWKSPLRILSDANSIPEFNHAIWKEGGWSKCSSACGEGIRRRTLTCHDSNDDSRLSLNHCSSENKPKSIEKCIGMDCSYWIIGEWSQCYCDRNIREREVICTTDSTDNRSDCDINNKPNTYENCECAHQPHFYHHYENQSEWKIGPWAECSVSCGNGVKRRQVVCYNLQGEQSNDCDIYRKPSEIYECNNGPCPDWLTEDWSECSASCGEGKQIRSVNCFNDDGHRIADNLCDHSKKPQEVQRCLKSHCSGLKLDFEWITGPWSQCSASCGEGIQHRNIECLNAFGHKQKESNCLLPVPAPTQKCVISVCPTWKWSEWSICPKSCGFHEQYRHAHCIRGERIVNDEECFETKPDTGKRRCKIPSECSFRYRKGLWSQCLAPCGSTHKTREVVCVDNENNNVPEELCSSLRKPKTRRRCRLKPCPYMWVPDHWSECSKTCGEGFRTRRVTCHAVNRYGWTDPQEIKHNAKQFCNLSRHPKEIETCKYGECNSGYVWKPDAWQSCKGPCYSAKQKRKLRCFTFDGHRVPNFKCNISFKPRKKRRCQSSPECPPKSCLEFHQRGKTEDGNYQISIKGKNVTLYCYAMNSNYPKEYINLRDKNYAVIHSTALGSHFRSDTSETCHLNDINRACDCIRRDYGYTIFSKVALNITSLRLITDDYTFSTTYHGRPVPFGTAGDCYRRPNCPQGIFFISLQGTDFRIANTTSWTSRARLGHVNLHQTSNDQVVKGKCGGYCDTCSPDPKLGLSVDITLPL